MPRVLAPVCMHVCIHNVFTGIHCVPEILYFLFEKGNISAPQTKIAEKASKPRFRTFVLSFNGHVFLLDSYGPHIKRHVHSFYSFDKKICANLFISFFEWMTLQNPSQTATR